MSATATAPDASRLPKRQRQVFEFVSEFIRAHGKHPAGAVVSAHLGFCSPLTANEYLRVLDKKGFAVRSRRYTRTREERFWEKVSRSEGCWEWTAFIGRGGYGTFDGDKKAHRVAWELTSGPIPDGRWVLHRCDNRKCVRPDHLFLGTRRDNIDDMVAKGRQARGEQIACRQRGELSHVARLRAHQIPEIRRRVEMGEPKASVARAFGVCEGTIRLVVRRETWSNV